MFSGYLVLLSLFSDLTISHLADVVRHFLNNVLEGHGGVVFRTLLGCQYVHADGALMSLYVFVCVHVALGTIQSHSNLNHC